MSTMWPDGYYLARHADGSTFVVLRQNCLWYCCGVGSAIRFDDHQIIRWIDTKE